MARAGATFVQGAEGNCDFNIVLSEAQYMTTFSSGCSTEYSCRVGENVIIKTIAGWRQRMPGFPQAGTWRDTA